MAEHLLADNTVIQKCSSPSQKKKKQIRLPCIHFQKPHCYYFMFHFTVLDAENKVKHKDAYSIQGGKARCNRGVSLFTPASMKDSRVTINQEIWRESACVKGSVRDRCTLECVRNNARHHLSKNSLILTKAQHHQSHTSEVMEWHVMYSGVPMERIKSILEDHLSFHNCYALYKNISNFIFNVSITCST